MARATEDVDDFDGTVDIADDRPPPPPLSVARHLIDEPSRMAKFMIAGGVAGAVSRTATAPIDRLKLLLQVRRRRRRRRAGAGGHGIDDADRTRGPFFAVDLFFLSPASHLDSPSLNSTRLSLSQLNSTSFSAQVNDSAKPMTIRDGLRSMLREGTPRAFFRGNGANVLKIAPETALKLTFNDRIKRAVASGSPDPGASLSPAERFVAGAAAGALAQSVIYPLELIRTRLAICPKGTYRGIADAAARVFRNEGPKAFYRGLAPSLIGILPYAGVDIAAFETLKEALLDAYEPRGEPPPPAAIIAAGAASSSVAQFCSYPLALVRTRLQAQGAGGRPIKYDGMVDVIRKTVASEGVRGLYKGEKKKRRGGSNCVFFLRVPLRRHLLVRVRGDQELAGAGQKGLKRKQSWGGRGKMEKGREEKKQSSPLFLCHSPLLCPFCLTKESPSLRSVRRSGSRVTNTHTQKSLVKSVHLLFKISIALSSTPSPDFFLLSSAFLFYFFLRSASTAGADDLRAPATPKGNRASRFSMSDAAAAERRQRATVAFAALAAASARDRDSSAEASPERVAASSRSCCCWQRWAAVGPFFIAFFEGFEALPLPPPAAPAREAPSLPSFPSFFFSPLSFSSCE